MLKWNELWGKPLKFGYNKSWGSNYAVNVLEIRNLFKKTEQKG